MEKSTSYLRSEKINSMVNSQCHFFTVQIKHHQFVTITIPIQDLVGENFEAKLILN